jgi:hypothetical protein
MNKLDSALLICLSLAAAALGIDLVDWHRHGGGPALSRSGAGHGAGATPTGCSDCRRGLFPVGGGGFSQRCFRGAKPTICSAWC